MSFISVLANENILTVMTDGQVTDIEGKSCNDNFPKFKLINDHQLFAESGDYSNAEYLLNEINFQNKKFSLEKVHNTIKEILLLTYNRKGTTNSVIIGGIDIDDQMKVYKISVVDGEIKSEGPLIPKGDGFVIAFLTSSKIKISDDDVENLFKKLLMEFHFDSNKYLDIQKIVNDIVAENDSTVNINVFPEKITR